MKSRILKIIVAVLVVIAIGFGGFYGYNKFFVKKTAAATTQYYAVTATTMNLQTTVQGTGSAYAAVTKDIAPNNNGTLEDLNVKVGDTVKSGQKLFVSEGDELSKNVTSAKNNLTKQELTLSSDESAQKVDENKVTMDKLSVSDAQTQLDDAKKQLSNMTVYSPIGGIVTAVNNTNGDSVQPGKAILTVVDMSSLKIKVSVDELDIDKIKVGQKAEIKFDAVEDKTFEGAVETIAQVGNASNNVTTYDVVVSISSPSGIKLGMNGNVTITVASKANALVIPAEALTERNSQYYVLTENTDNASSENSSQGGAGSQNQSGYGQGGSQYRNFRNSIISGTNGAKLTAVKIGLQTENYIEITEGLTAGQKVLVQLPQTTSTTTNNRNSYSGFGGNMGGFGGMSGFRSQGGNNSYSRQQSGSTSGNRN